MNILYITFGDNMANHLQATFSICSFLAATEKPQSITVYTDVPGFYNHLQHKANIVAVNEQQLQEWKGPHHFFWRIKIKAIEKFAAAHAGLPVLYLDTDTFLYNDLSLLTKPLAAGHALMHLDEGKLSEMKGKTTNKMWKALKNQPYGGLTLEARYHMWNAGVVASPNTKGGEEFRLALKLCDEMCAANIRPRLLEQFALSVALEEMYRLRAAEGAIAHYWSTKKEWNDVINKFVLTAYFQGQSFEEMTANFHQLDLTATPIFKSVKNTSVKLHQLVNKLYKEEAMAFVKKAPQ